MSQYAKKALILTIMLMVFVTSQAFAAVYYVSPIGNDSNNGLSWGSAKASIANAINAATANDEIWVAAGIYVERITLKPGVELYGGFAGTETTRDQRNWDAFKSVIDGNDGGSVVTAPTGADSDTIICGFTIRNGFEDNGGGIYCQLGSSPYIANNIITDNDASDPIAYKPSGGGIYCQDTTNAGEAASPIILNNKIIGNRAFRGGGLFLASYSQAVVANNLIIGNTVANHGGGIYCDNVSVVSVINNTLVGNQAVHGGGIFCDNKSEPTLINNIIAFGERGIFVEWDATPTINNNCVFGNLIYNYSGTTPGTNDISADPLFVNAAAGNYHLTSTSPCIDKGDSTAVESGWLDIDRQERIQGAKVDIGADEVIPLSPPVNAALSPDSGQLLPGVQTTITTTYTDPDGYTNLADAYLLINTTFSGVNALYLRYDADENKLYIRNNSNSTWIGGCTPGTSDVIENNQAKVYCSDTTVSGTDDTLIINWRIEPTPAFAGPGLQAWMLVVDDADKRDGWELKGSYNGGVAPVNVSLSPTSGAIPINTKTTFSAKYSDADGAANLNGGYLLINTALTGVNGAYVCYSEKLNLLYLRNDANTAWLGGVIPGASTVIENSQVKVYCAETTVNRTATEITINWRIEFKSTMAGKSPKAWMLAVDDTGLRDGWDQMGSYSIGSPPVNISLTPNSAAITTGSKVTITSQASDPDGNANISGIYVLLNGPFTGANAAYVCYSEKFNSLYLRNDANTAWLGGVTPGTAGVIENSQCILYPAETTVTRSGNQITVNWRLEFKPALASANWKGWMLTIDDSNLRDGWEQLATYTFN